MNLSKVNTFLFRQFYGTSACKGKTPSSSRWLRRQQTDPINQQAKELGFRSRAAIKLLQINQKYKIICPGFHVIDLGAAPGGWTQVAVEEVKRFSKLNEKNNASLSKKGRVIAIDIIDFPMVQDAVKIIGDFRQPTVRSLIEKQLTNGSVDTVLSDMAPSMSGVRSKDQYEQSKLHLNALRLAKLYLRIGGNFLIKVFVSGAENEIRQEMKTLFEVVKTVKPSASRSDSSEIYYLGIRFLGSPKTKA